MQTTMNFFTASGRPQPVRRHWASSSFVMGHGRLSGGGRRIWDAGAGRDDDQPVIAGPPTEWQD
jgi:hypothetical protein